MPDQRPHIILFLTDQQRHDTIAAWGYRHMDALAARGVSFTSAY